MARTYTIGELARATATPVATLRRYVALGLVPGNGVYRDPARLRLESIRALRGAGVPLTEIRRAFGRRATPRAVIAMHLTALDHERARVDRTAAVLRAALDGKGVDAKVVLRRLDALARAAAIERAEALVDAVRRAAAGDEPGDLRTSVVEAAFRDLPDALTDAQWDALVELVDLLGDRRLVRELRDDRRWALAGAERRYDVASWRKLLDDLVSQAHGAWVRGDLPSGRRGRVLAKRWVNHAASLERVSMHAAAVELIARAEHSDPRIERVWELVAIVRGWSGPPPHIVAFRWLVEAVRAHLHQLQRT